MHVDLITIGTELVLGFVLDGNGARLGRDLAAAGIQVARRTSVGDQPEAIRDSIADALRRTGVVITTGGLGPTRDDVTKRVVADLLAWPLEFNESVWQAVLARFARFGRIPTASNRSQAEVPRGAVVLPNPRGTAPGLWLEGEHGLLIMLPGVPGEMVGLLHEEVLPRLVERADRLGGRGRPILSHVLRTTGMAESHLGEMLTPVEERLAGDSEGAPLTLAYLPGPDGVDLRLTAWGDDQAVATRRFQTVELEARRLLGDRLYATGETTLAERVLQELQGRGAMLVAAESCTGGLVGKRLTDVPGSSGGFRGGVIAYDNEVKVRALDVDRALLETHGAVSREVAEAMARGALTRVGGEVAVSITGVAGPDGGTEAKPVGTVFAAVADGNGVESTRLLLVGERAEIRARAAQAALFLVYRRLLGPAFREPASAFNPAADWPPQVGRNETASR